jgi:hypothetical protein
VASLHRGAMSGTASELLATLRPRVVVGNDSWLQSPRTLYFHVESHGQILRSLVRAITGIHEWFRFGRSGAKSPQESFRRVHLESPAAPMHHRISCADHRSRSTVEP